MHDPVPQATVPPTDPTPMPQPEATPPVTPASVARPERAEDIDALLAAAIAASRAPADTEPVAPAVEPTPEPESAPEPETPAPAEIDETVADPAVTPVVSATPEKILPSKIPTDQFSQRDAFAIRAIKEARELGETIDLEEAIRRTHAAHPSLAPKPSAPEVAAPTADLLDERATAAAANLDELYAQAAVHAENQTTLTPEYLALTKQIGAATQEQTRILVAIDDRDARNAEQAAQAARQKQKSEAQHAWDAAKAVALDIFPNAANTKHPHGKQVVALMREWSNPTHTRHADLSAPDAPTRLAKAAANVVAQEMATEKKIPVHQALASLLVASSPPASDAATEATPAPTTTATKPTPFRPATGATASAKPAIETREQVLARASKSNNPHDLDKALGLDRIRPTHYFA